MLKELIEQERSYLNHFFDSINLQALEKFVQILNDCQGMMIFSGIGKSGLVAEKIAMTMTSTGSKAFFLSPTNALHGDIGIVTERDIFVMLSKSGESDELLHLIPFMRNKGVKIAAIVMNVNSRLAKAADYVLPLPQERELCPYDLAPTTSTVIQMIVGDVIAVALMKMHGFSLDDFARNHPAGRIGRRMITKVRDLMIGNEGIPLCHPQDLLGDTLVELSNKRCGCVLVIDEERHLLGIFTDGDLRRSLQKFGAQSLAHTMGELMTRTPRWIDQHALAYHALHLMEEDQKRPIMVLAVLDDAQKVVGVIKMHDIVQSGL